MDERTARKLRAAAEHERRNATAAAEAVTRLEAKAERDRARLDAALAEARRSAEEAEHRAGQAERVARAAGLAPGAVDGPTTAASAGVAEGEAV